MIAVVITVKGIFDWADLILVKCLTLACEVVGSGHERQARALLRAFGLRGLPPASASNRGPPCERYLDVAQQPIATAGSKGLPVFSMPKHSTNSLRIAATTAWV
jgi:hypothetical protein